jgi:ABC-type Na+ efflux pump permease subunit
MKLLGLLLEKDLRRAWRNPVPWLIHLVIPLCMAALLGAAFGGRSESDMLGRIRFAVVDEDQSSLMEFLKGAMNQREASKYLEPVFLNRTDAMRELGKGRLSAVLILPEAFARNYLSLTGTVTLELVKNPAQAWHPAVLEEMLGATVTALNALRRTVGAELQQWAPVIEGNGNPRRVAELIVQSGDTFERVRRYLDPPLIKPAKELRSATKPEGRTVNVFGFVLVGLSAMFLFFIAGTAMTDLLREQRLGTLGRYHTTHDSLAPFIAAKVVSTWALLSAGSLILLGGGGVIFKMSWQRPDALAILAGAYCLFACGFMSLAVALARTERRADVFCNLAGMFLGLVGGCAFPKDQLPAFIRDHVSPLTPPNWFVEAVRGLEFGGTSADWAAKAALMAGLGVALAALAAWILRRQLEKGVRP